MQVKCYWYNVPAKRLSTAVAALQQNLRKAKTKQWFKIFWISNPVTQKWMIMHSKKCRFYLPSLKNQHLFHRCTRDGGRDSRSRCLFYRVIGRGKKETLKNTICKRIWRASSCQHSCTIRPTLAHSTLNNLIQAATNSWQLDTLVDPFL